MEFSANDIAALLNGEVEGDGNVKVNNISKIELGFLMQFCSIDISSFMDGKVINEILIK